MTNNGWIEINPSLHSKTGEFISFVRALAKNRQRAQSGPIPNSSERLEFACRIVNDLVATGWEVKVERGRTFLKPLAELEHRGVASKDILRAYEQARRDAQLEEPSVQSFIEGMEKRRLRGKGWHSIFSLMRDGQDLARSLREIQKFTAEQRLIKLNTVIQPYLQVADAAQNCAYTGLNLFDIWRYFRHTWVNQYQSTPGRNLHILVRDAASPNHPVIGIAALGSAVVQQTCRDRALGWDPDAFIAKLRASSDRKYTRWLLDTVSRMIEELYVDDLFSDELIAEHDVEVPTPAIISRLTEESRRCAAKHESLPNVSSVRDDVANGKLPLSWISLARSYLYRGKRCKLLSDFLRVRMVLQEFKVAPGKEKAFRAALESSTVCQAITSIVRRIKSERVGIDMMDITVCGAVAPYNHILGGKLVCMLLTSPQMGAVYQDKYRDYQSIIASGLSGKPINRRPTLVCLGTTSLYGCGSSQYNRIKIPAETVGGQSGEMVQYAEIGTSKGFGTFHFNRETLAAMDRLLAHTKMKKVNYIFGEGVNPKLRKLRDAIDLIGLPSNVVLNHGCLRLVYLVQFISNPTEFLLGLDKRPKWIFPRNDPQNATAALVQFWMQRWLSMRLDTAGVIEKVASHSIAYPITHGARVRLPGREKMERADELMFG